MMIIEARDLAKSFRGGDGQPIHVLDGVDLAVRRGEMVAIVGASGAGKSTLLHVLGALDRPTRGYVMLDGEPLHGRLDDDLAAIRNRKIGFVFQFHHLLREFSALENVMMPLRIAGMDVRKARSRAEELLARVGLPPDRLAGALSSGMRQRLRWAWALLARPRVLLLDEPFQNFDAPGEGSARSLLLEHLAQGLAVVASPGSLEIPRVASHLRLGS
jgi:lipoprotein-releasing system ATP-binding protein